MPLDTSGGIFNLVPIAINLIAINNNYEFI
jgi:hypothetical protein